MNNIWLIGTSFEKYAFKMAGLQKGDSVFVCFWHFWYWLKKKVSYLMIFLTVQTKNLNAYILTQGLFISYKFCSKLGLFDNLAFGSCRTCSTSFQSNLPIIKFETLPQTLYSSSKSDSNSTILKTEPNSCYPF